jgi:DNA-binding HxlR family transcriptional regulator
LLVVRELVFGPKRYTDLLADLPGISTNVLSRRLDELERAGVVQRRKLVPRAASWAYELTEWGHALDPIMRQLGRWGASSPVLPRDLHLSVNSLAMSLRTNFDPARAEGHKARFELRFAEDRFDVAIDAGGVSVQRGNSARPDAIIDTTPETLAGLIYDGSDVAAAVAAQEVRVTGDMAAVERFLTFFALPEPAMAAAPE